MDEHWLRHLHRSDLEGKLYPDTSYIDDIVKTINLTNHSGIEECKVKWITLEEYVIEMRFKTEDIGKLKKELKNKI